MEGGGGREDGGVGWGGMGGWVGGVVVVCVDGWVCEGEGEEGGGRRGRRVVWVWVVARGEGGVSSRSQQRRIPNIPGMLRAAIFAIPNTSG